MYDFIEGTLELQDRDTITIKTLLGIGYRIVIGKNSSLRSQLSNSSVRIWTELVIREDKHELYGFSTIEERRLFCLLQEVSGVGPKMAMAICGGLATGAIIHAIGTKESSTLQEISGVGKKTAERIILELHEKITKILPSDTGYIEKSENEKTLFSQAFIALKTLGFKEEEAKTRIKKVLLAKPVPTTCEELIQRSLQCNV